MEFIRYCSEGKKEVLGYSRQEPEIFAIFIAFYVKISGTFRVMNYDFRCTTISGAMIYLYTCIQYVLLNSE